MSEEKKPSDLKWLSKTYLGVYFTAILIDYFLNGAIRFYINNLILYILSIIALLSLLYPFHQKLVFYSELILLLVKRKILTKKNLIPYLFLISFILLLIPNFLDNFHSGQIINIVINKYKIIETYLFYITAFFGIFSVYLKKNYLLRVLATERKSSSKEIFLYIILSVLIISGGILRYLQTADIGQSVDSFFHTVNASNLVSGGGNFYDRGQLYTYLIALSYKIFGISEISSHLIDIIFSSLTIPLMYFAGRKIFNKEIGVISATLLTFSFWHIGEAGNMRMYTMLIFFSLLFFLFLYFVFFENGIFSRRTKPLDKILKRKWFYFLGSFLILAISFHLHSVIAAVFLPILLFLTASALIFLLTDTTKKGSSTRTDNILSLILLIIVLFGSVFLSYPSIIGQFDVNFTYNNTVIQNWNILSEELRNSLGWFLNLYGNHIFYLVLILSLAISFFFKKMEYFFIWFLFVASWLENLFLFNRYFSPRYVILLLPLFILLVSVVLYYSIPHKNKIVKIFLFILLIILINPWNKVEKIINQKSGENYNQEIYYDFRGAINSIPIRSDDVLIETSFGPFDFYQKTKANTLNISRLTTDGNGSIIPVENILWKFFNTISKYKHGWILTDYYRFEKWNCEEYVPCEIRKFILDNPQIFKKIEYPRDPTLYIYEFSTLQCAPSN